MFDHAGIGFFLLIHNYNVSSMLSLKVYITPIGCPSFLVIKWIQIKIDVICCFGRDGLVSCNSLQQRR